VAPTRDTVLDAIKVVESRGTRHEDLYPHGDGKSWGYYGLTQSAIDELVRLGLLESGTTVRDVCDGQVDERDIAGKYLDVCLDRARRQDCYGSTAGWIEAALVYHGGTGERLAPARVQYGRRLRRAIEEAAR